MATIKGEGRVKVYQDINTGKKYIWNGSAYEELKAPPKPKSTRGGKAKIKVNLPFDKPEDQEQNNNQDQDSKGSKDKQNSEDSTEKDSKSGSEDISGEDEKAKEQIKKDAEDIADAAEDLKDAVEDGESKETDEISQNAEKIIKDAKDITKDKLSDEEDLAQRIKKIADAFQDELMKAKIMRETNIKINQEKLDKESKAMLKYKSKAKYRFAKNVRDFMAKEIGYDRGRTYTRYNSNYYGSPFLVPTVATKYDVDKVPVINFYFDKSGSWEDEAKIKEGKDVVGNLNEHVKSGKLKMNIYYFSNNVHKSQDQALREGGTEGQPILDHIQSTKPDNVVIMTDGDITDCRSNVTVPGSVWLVFKGGISDNLIDHIHGKKQTKIYDLDE